MLAQRVKHEVGFDALLYLVGCAGAFPADVVGQSSEWFGAMRVTSVWKDVSGAGGSRC